MINYFSRKNGDGLGKLKKYLKKRPVVSDESQFAKNNITNSKIGNEFNRHFISIAKHREEISIESKHKYSVDIKNPNCNYSFNCFNPYNQ